MFCVCVCIDWSYQSVDGCYYFKSKKKNSGQWSVFVCVMHGKKMTRKNMFAKEKRNICFCLPLIHSIYLPPSPPRTTPPRTFATATPPSPTTRSTTYSSIYFFSHPRKRASSAPSTISWFLTFFTCVPRESPSILSFWYPWKVIVVIISSGHVLSGWMDGWIRSMLCE